MDTDTRRGLDLWLVSICMASAWIAWMYLEEGRLRWWVMICGSAGTLFFLLLALLEGKLGRPRQEGFEGFLDMSGMITELALLSEEDGELMVWDLYGRTSAGIGRSVKGQPTDIDLAQSHYASMVDPEHAVLNFTAANWYVEDLGSRNGLQIRKWQDGRIYRLSSDTPCRLDRGDVIYVGMNRLLLK